MCIYCSLNKIFVWDQPDVPRPGAVLYAERMIEHPAPYIIVIHVLYRIAFCMPIEASMGSWHVLYMSESNVSAYILTCTLFPMEKKSPETLAVRVRERHRVVPQVRGREQTVQEVCGWPTSITR